MNNIRKYLILLLAGGIFGLTSCSPPPPPTASSPSPEVESPSPTPQASPEIAPPSPTPEKPTAAAANASIPVTIYRVDSQCSNLVPEKINVAAAQPIDATVGRVLAAQNNPDFDLSGYRVNVSNGTATIDLRMVPNSTRTFTSLSSCEQFALFGSLRKTLTEHPQWQIKSVRFTDRGKEIVL